MSLREKRKNMIIQKLTNGAKKWKQLETLTQEKGWLSVRYQRGDIKKGRGSLRDLSLLLNELEEEGKIVKVWKSRRNVVYLVSEDAKVFLHDWEILRLKAKDLPEALEFIRKSKGELTPEQAQNWISGLTFFGLKNFFAALVIAVKVEKKWAYHARFMLDRFVDNFGFILLECGKTYPDLMDSAIETVALKLESLALSYSPKKSEVEKKEK